MVEMSAKSARTVRIWHRAQVLRLGLVLCFSAVSAGSSPLLEATPIQTLDSLPRNYCLGDVASLGTGLVQAPVSSGTKSGLHKVRTWTGWIRASASGRYEFSLPGSGGYIFVNKQQIFSRSEMSLRPTVIQIELVYNRFYAITVETPNIEYSTLPLQWHRPDGRQEIVPKAYLYAPVATTNGSETNLAVPIE